MPTVHIEKGFHFRFYAADKGEPSHIHAVQGRKRAKIWLQDMSLAYNRGFNQREISEIFRIAEQNRVMFMEAWNAFFS